MAAVRRTAAPAVQRTTSAVRRTAAAVRRRTAAAVRRTAAEVIRTAAAVRRMAVVVRRTAAAVRRAAIAGQSGANGLCGERIRHGEGGGISNVPENVGMSCHLCHRFVVGGCKGGRKGRTEGGGETARQTMNLEIINSKVRQLDGDVDDRCGG